MPLPRGWVSAPWRQKPLSAVRRKREHQRSTFDHIDVDARCPTIYTVRDIGVFANRLRPEDGFGLAVAIIGAKAISQRPIIRLGCTSEFYIGEYIVAPSFVPVA